MTEAERFVNEFEKQERNSDGFYRRSPWNFLYGNRQCVDVEETGSGAIDGTEIWKFVEDDSLLRVGNPLQISFPASLTVIHVL